MTVVENDVFRFVERQLYSYKDNRKRLAEKRGQVLHASANVEREGRSKAHKSDPTALRGIKLADICDTTMYKWVEVITDALAAMPGEQRTLVRLKYFEAADTKEPLWERMNISRSLFYDWRDKIITYIVLLATQRGILSPIRDENRAQECTKIQDFLP